MTIYHQHHITPKHMGGSDDPSNLVKVTVEQHALLHKQLWEDLGQWQDYVAWKALTGCIDNAEANLLALKLSMKGNTRFKGRKHTTEAKEKIRQGHIGKQHTDETKQKMKGRSSWNKGKSCFLGSDNPFYGKQHTSETKEKISNSLRGKTLSEEHKQKLSIAKLGKKRGPYKKLTSQEI
jgi:hypothetical protein